jgi:hypothetical protein
MTYFFSLGSFAKGDGFYLMTQKGGDESYIKKKSRLELNSIINEED